MTARVDKIRHKRSGVASKVPTLADLSVGELAVNYFDGKLFTKRVYEAANTSIEEKIVEFVANVPFENIIFVSKEGDDRNAGSSWSAAVNTVEKAIELAATKSTTPVLIEIAPGRYQTRGHIDMPDNTMIRTAHRTVIFEPEPGYEERNVFRMGSGCFIEGPLFEGFRVDDFDNPTEGFAISFRPGAVINRAPYAHKIAVRNPPTWDVVSPPLDRNNGNPYVPRGGGVVLADGSVCSQYSMYPNIMTWGATPVSHNGIGYCAKNGGLINAVNAVSLWAHKHFYAVNGGHIILSSCSTQFGDYTLVSSGERSMVQPDDVAAPLVADLTSANAIDANRTIIIDNMWNLLVANNFTAGWTQREEDLTRRDANTLLQTLIWTIGSGNDKPVIDFIKGLFGVDGNTVFDNTYLAAFIASFEYIRDEIALLPDVTVDSNMYVAAVVDLLNQTLTTPSFVAEPSTITAIGHTFTAVLTGVALSKIPPARNAATIQDSILELDNGVVIASGQDDQGNAIFVGGLEINADTGELGGPPFQQAVNRIATRTAISRSF